MYTKIKAIWLTEKIHYRHLIIKVPINLQEMCIVQPESHLDFTILHWLDFFITSFELLKVLPQYQYSPPIMAQYQSDSKPD